MGMSVLQNLQVLERLREVISLKFMDQGMVMPNQVIPRRTPELLKIQR